MAGVFLAPAAGDLPVNGVFSGSVCACNANATAKDKSETKSDFFIVECKGSDRINKMNKTALDNPNAPESTILRILCILSKRIPFCSL